MAFSAITGKCVRDGCSGYTFNGNKLCSSCYEAKKKSESISSMQITNCQACGVSTGDNIELCSTCYTKYKGKIQQCLRCGASSHGCVLCYWCNVVKKQQTQKIQIQQWCPTVNCVSCGCLTSNQTWEICSTCYYKPQQLHKGYHCKRENCKSFTTNAWNICQGCYEDGYPDNKI